jgi:hypothetical protein
MRATRWAVLSVTVVVTAALGGCGAGADGRTETGPGSAGTPAAGGATDDAATCTAYGDVLTILENADLGLADGRMAEQERDGWYRLATRVLDRLPSGGDSAVQTAIAELQEVAPAVEPGEPTESAGPGSPEWDDAQGALGTACDALGAPLSINVFTGG